MTAHRQESSHMPLQNRVDPNGVIHAVGARGLFTGNRGVIHDPGSRSLLRRRWTTKAWIICDCGYKGRKRDVFGRNTKTGGAGWTNLFFLDEVTALAAGHRPCFECRREKASEFADCFARAFDIARPKVADMDERLHAERLAAGGPVEMTGPDEIAGLPEGAMLFAGETFFAKKDNTLRSWSFSGYRDPAPSDLARPRFCRATPSTTIAVLRAGYRPRWHPTA